MIVDAGRLAQRKLASLFFDPKTTDRKEDLHETAIFDIFFFMPKTPAAITNLPPSSVRALEKLGADLAVARLRRKEPLTAWARRLGITVPTLMRMEAGEPGVGIGIYATALWMIGRGNTLANLASPEEDLGALELDIREATELGKARARASEQSRLAREHGKATQ